MQLGVEGSPTPSSSTSSIQTCDNYFLYKLTKNNIAAIPTWHNILLCINSDIVLFFVHKHIFFCLII